jgi:hypothetical protein
MFLLNGNPISIDNEQVIDGVRYPHLRDPALRESLGITEAPEPEFFDQRFYWGVGSPKLLNDREEVDQDGNPMWVKVYDPATKQMVDSDKRLVTKGLKSQWISQAKDTAGSLLSRSDWKVVRAAEGIKPCDASTLAFRAAVRAYSDSLEASIAACSSVEELITVVSNQNWPKEDN